MKRLRRALLELWAILPLALVVGFLGPFGTYLNGDLGQRFGRWWILLMGAYVLARPTMLFWYWIARSTGLPRGWVMFWGMAFSSVPMAIIWRAAGLAETRILGDVAGILPFALLCSLAIMGVAWWADRADAQIEKIAQGNRFRSIADDFRDRDAGMIGNVAANPPRATGSDSGRPRLYARLTPRFEGDVLALESEDHYVRVHGARHSELLLMRLRDAIAEMDNSPGEQTHRSWWIARDAVAEVVGSGRHRQIRLVNDTRAPVARDSVERLQRSGFLPKALEGAA